MIYGYRGREIEFNDRLYEQWIKCQGPLEDYLLDNYLYVTYINEHPESDGTKPENAELLKGRTDRELKDIFERYMLEEVRICLGDNKWKP